MRLLDDLEATHGERPGTVLADARGAATSVTLRRVDGHVALGRERRRPVAVDAAKYPATARMAKKLGTEAGPAQYAQRKWLSDVPNGWIKEALGLRRVCLRGLDNVQGEWHLVLPSATTTCSTSFG